MGHRMARPHWMRYTRASAVLMLALFMQTACGICTAATTPLTVCWQLEPTRPMLGEPVLLHYTITNTSAETVWVDWKGENLTRGNSTVPTLPPWLTVVLSARLGAMLTPTAEPVSPFTAADYAVVSPRRELAAGASREGTLVLSRWYTLPRAGSYQIALHVRLPYRVGSDSQKQPLSSDQTLPLLVSSPNPVGLRQVAAALARAAVQPAGFEQTITVLDSLFSMPEAVAYEAWRQVALDPRLGSLATLQVTLDLARVGSANAVDLLYRMATDPGDAYDRQALAKQGLLRIQANSAPEGQMHIQRLLLGLSLR